MLQLYIRFHSCTSYENDHSITFAHNTLKKCTQHLIHQPPPVPLRCLPPLTTTQGGGGTTTIASPLLLRQWGGRDLKKCTRHLVRQPPLVPLRCQPPPTTTQGGGGTKMIALPPLPLADNRGGRGVITYAATTDPNKDKGEGCRCCCL
jgi:hypothetical protein